MRFRIVRREFDRALDRRPCRRVVSRLLQRQRQHSLRAGVIRRRGRGHPGLLQGRIGFTAAEEIEDLFVHGYGIRREAR
ncbi:hypothetical protein GCM10025793_07610 [Lysobacter lycopersici]